MYSIFTVDELLCFALFFFYCIIDLMFPVLHCVFVCFINEMVQVTGVIYRVLLF